MSEISVRFILQNKLMMRKMKAEICSNRLPITDYPLPITDYQISPTRTPTT